MKPIKQGPFRPNSQGMIVPTQNKIHTGGMIEPYTKPTNALRNMDKVAAGGKPRIAIIRSTGGIGDVLMTTPTVKAIAKKYDIQVVYGTDPNYLEGALPKVLEGNPYIEKVVPWKTIDPEDFNAILNLTCPCVAHEQPLAPPINRIDLFARHVGLSLPLLDPTMDYQIKVNEIDWARQYLAQNGLSKFKIILVQPSASHVARDAPVDKLQRALANIAQLKRDVRFIVTTHSTDNVKSNWHFSEIHVVNDFDIRKIAALIYVSKLVICPDSAILHVASALHKPTVTLFGPTDPRARVNYHPEAVAIWGGKELKCYPSWYKPPIDNYLCWKRLEEKDIVGVSLALLDNLPLPESRDLVHFGSFTQSATPQDYCKII